MRIQVVIVPRDNPEGSIVKFLSASNAALFAKLSIAAGTKVVSIGEDGELLLAGDTFDICCRPENSFLWILKNAAVQSVQ